MSKSDRSLRPKMVTGSCKSDKSCYIYKTKRTFSKIWKIWDCVYVYWITTQNGSNASCLVVKMLQELRRAFTKSLHLFEFAKWNLQLTTKKAKFQFWWISSQVLHSNCFWGILKIKNSHKCFFINIFSTRQVKASFNEELNGGVEKRYVGTCMKG